MKKIYIPLSLSLLVLFSLGFLLTNNLNAQGKVNNQEQLNALNEEKQNISKISDSLRENTDKSKEYQDAENFITKGEEGTLDTQLQELYSSGKNGANGAFILFLNEQTLEGYVVKSDGINWTLKEKDFRK